MDIWENRPFSDVFEAFKNQRRIDHVDRVVNLDKQTFFRNYLEQGYPVVFNADFLPPELSKIVNGLKSINGIEINIRNGDYADPSKYIKERKIEKMPMKIFFTEIFDKGQHKSHYAGNFSLPTSIVEQLGIRPPDFFNTDEFEPPAFWAGGKGTVTPLHKDGSKNFAVHLSGTKRWTLFPPRDAEYLYMYRVIEDSDFAPSQVDLRSVDYEKFDLFSKAKSVTCELQAGEVLFLPEGWAHFVENLEPTIMVNFWHRNKM